MSGVSGESKALSPQMSGCDLFLRVALILSWVCILGWSPSIAAADGTVPNSTWPTTDQIVHALLSNASAQPLVGSEFHPLTRWEKNAISLWILGRKPEARDIQDRIASEFQRIFSLAHKKLTVCIDAVDARASSIPCSAQPKADIVYMDADTDDLFYNNSFLRTKWAPLNFHYQDAGDFYAQALTSYESGFPCHAAIIAAGNSNQIGVSYIGAILTNGETHSRFGDCLRFLAYRAVGVAPISGQIGSSLNPPVFADQTISILYSKELPAGATERQLRDIVSKLRPP